MAPDSAAVTERHFARFVTVTCPGSSRSPSWFKTSRQIA